MIVHLIKDDISLWRKAQASLLSILKHLGSWCLIRMPFQPHRHCLALFVWGSGLREPDWLHSYRRSWMMELQWWALTLLHHKMTFNQLEEGPSREMNKWIHLFLFPTEYFRAQFLFVLNEVNHMYQVGALACLACFLSSQIRRWQPGNNASLCYILFRIYSFPCFTSFSSISLLCLSIPGMLVP